MGMETTNPTTNHPPTMTWETWRKMGNTKRFAYKQACNHDHVELLDGDYDTPLPRCTDCTSIGPWAGHATHGHFPNGQPVR